MSAVTIDRLTDERVTLATVMKTVAPSVDLKKVGVTVRNTRQTRTGGIFLDVDSPEGADTLAEKTRQAVAGKARVTRPERQTLILLLSEPSWADVADVRGGLATFDVTPKTSPKMTLRHVDTGPRLSRSLTTRPSRWHRRGPWSSDGPDTGSGCSRRSNRNASAARIRKEMQGIFIYSWIFWENHYVVNRIKIL